MPTENHPSEPAKKYQTPRLQKYGRMTAHTTGMGSTAMTDGMSNMAMR